MSRKKPNLVLIVWDIGIGSKGTAPDGETYLAIQKRCINKIVSNKILFEPKDEIALLTFATDETNHSFEMNNFPNINLQCGFNCEKIKIMDAVDAIVSTEREQEFLGALCVALNVIKDKLTPESKPTTSKASKAKPSAPYDSLKIILLSTLTGEFSKDETITVTKHLKKIRGMDCKFFVIGPEINLDIDELKKEDNLNYFDACPDLMDAETALKHIFKYVSGAYWTFDEAMMNLSTTTCKKVTPRNSKILLELGTNFKIKVQYFNEVCAEPRLEFKILNSADITKKTGYDRVYTAQGGKRKMVEEEEIIKGYKFGTSIIPLSEEDKSAMEYKSGSPCLKILGFCKQKDITPIMYAGITTVNISPIQNDPAAVVAFKALVKTMHQMGRVAVVRRVVTNNGKLLLAALIPRMLPDDERLICVELPFAEDVVHYQFPQFKPNVTDPQLAVVRELVESMNLMNAGPGGSEAFHPRSTPNPVKIHSNELVIQKHRAPNNPVQPPSKLILSLLEPPETILHAAENIEARLKATFEVAEVRASSAKIRVPRASVQTAPSDQDVFMDQDSQGGLDDVAANDAPQVRSVKIVQVGSITPAEDFQALIQQGVPLQEVCAQCQTIILQLAVRAQHDLYKPLTAIRVMRQACVKDNPLPYNDWLPEFRNELSERNKLGLWLMIMDENLGPITVEENPEAVLKRDDALKFLAEQPKDQESQKMDIDSLLEDM